MASLKNSEKRLLLLLGVALFIVANVIGEGIFGRRKAAAKVAIESYNGGIDRDEYRLRNRVDWDNKRLWLNRIQPRYLSEEAAATEVENHIKRVASASGAIIDQSKPTEPVANDSLGYIAVAMKVNISGTPEEVTRFVSYLQSREGFYSVPDVTFSSDRKDPAILRAALTVSRLYSTAPGAEAPVPTGFAGGTSPTVASRILNAVGGGDV